MAHLFGTLIHSMASLGCTNIYFYPAKPYIKQPNSSLSENAKYSTKIFCAGIFLPCRTHSATVYYSLTASHISNTVNSNSSAPRVKPNRKLIGSTVHVKVNAGITLSNIE